MPRFMAFGPNMLIDVDSLTCLVFEEKAEPPTLVFDFKDGTERRYTATPEEWQRVRAFLVKSGFVSEV